MGMQNHRTDVTFNQKNIGDVGDVAASHASTADGEGPDTLRALAQTPNQDRLRNLHLSDQDPRKDGSQVPGP